MRKVMQFLTISRILYDTINVDQWVKVIYKEEVFFRTVHEKRGSQLNV